MLIIVIPPLFLRECSHFWASFYLSLEQPSLTLVINFMHFSRAAIRLKDIEDDAKHCEKLKSNKQQCRYFASLYGLTGNPAEQRSENQRSTNIQRRSVVDDKRVNKEKKGEQTTKKEEPIRKIRRPTSIRRPKLIGKSVGGGALQAVAASRARASAPPRHGPTSVAARGHKEIGLGQSQTGKEGSIPAKSKGGDARDQVPAVLRKDVQSKAQLIKDSNIGAFGTPTKGNGWSDFSASHLLKDHYLLTKQSIRSCRKLPLGLFQDLTTKWMSIMKVKNMTHEGMEFILSQTTAIKSDSCEFLRSFSKQSGPFLEYCAQRITESQPGAQNVILRRDPTEAKPTETPVYIRRDLTTKRASYIAFLMLRFSVTNNLASKTIGHCHVWLFVAAHEKSRIADTTQLKKHLTMGMRRKKRRFPLSDRKSSSLSTVVTHVCVSIYRYCTVTSLLSSIQFIQLNYFLYFLPPL